MKIELDRCAAKILRLKAENEGVLNLNRELQLALCTKVLEKSKCRLLSTLYADSDPASISIILMF